MLGNLKGFVRYRMHDDGDYLVRDALDGLVINANHLEQHLRSTADKVKALGAPYLIDPMLWRFQVPAWWRREDGETKRNFSRLGGFYFAGTGHAWAESGITELSDSQWERVANNVVRYQRVRVPDEGGGLLSLMEGGQEPLAMVAPYLLASSTEHDRVNRLLLETSVEAAGAKVLAHLAIPLERFLDPSERRRVLAGLNPHLSSGCFIWIERLKEEMLLTDDACLSAFEDVVDRLAEIGLPVWNANGGFVSAALRERGIAGIVHNLYWVDRGMPAEQPHGIPHYSCTTYVTGLHRTVHYEAALQLARPLDLADYRKIYCGCYFCAGAIERDIHPLEHLVGVRTVKGPKGRSQMVPTETALASNTWHYLWSRRLEIQALATRDVRGVLEESVQAMRALNVPSERFVRLATHLRRAS
jgi:hypothetical protein